MARAALRPLSRFPEKLVRANLSSVHLHPPLKRNLSSALIEIRRLILFFYIIDCSDFVYILWRRVFILQLFWENV